MFTCSTCGKSWPENYCPECARTIERKPPSLPSAPSPQKPPPVAILDCFRKSPGTTPDYWLLILVIAFAVLGTAGYFGYQMYQLYDYPAGYRNRPSSGLHRPGENEFSQASDQLDSYKGTNAFGNSPAAVRMAAEFAATLKVMRATHFTPGSKIEILESTKGEFVTYCELHEEECAFIVHVPELRRFEKNFTEKVDARKLMAQAAWMSAQTVLKAHHAENPRMELAVGLRGIGQYGPIMIGYYVKDATKPDEGLIKYLDDGAQTHFLWPFFGPSTGGNVTTEKTNASSVR